MSKIYVGNLSWNTTDEILKREFSPYVEVMNAMIMKDRETGRSRGFGFVTVATEDEADNAVRRMNETDIDGRRVRVNLANAKTFGNGGFGGGGYHSGYGTSSYIGGYNSAYGEGENHSTLLERPAFSSQATGETDHDDIRDRRETIALVEEDDIRDEKEISGIRKDDNTGDEVEMRARYHTDTKEISAVAEEDDASSDTSSNGSGGSIFSIASRGSLGSAITNIFRDSTYTAEQVEVATNHLLLLLDGDEVLHSLFIAASQNASIGPHRLERNLRRLLGSYSEHLKDEAHDRLELLAARLVAIKAKFLAKSIVEKYIGSSDTASISADLPERVDMGVKNAPEVAEDDAKEEEDSTNYGDVVQDFAKVREFLRGSDSFQTLRIQLNDFVDRNKSNTKDFPPSISHKYSRLWFVASIMFWAITLTSTFAGMLLATSMPTVASVATLVIFTLFTPSMVGQSLSWCNSNILAWLARRFMPLIPWYTRYIRNNVGTIPPRQFVANILLYLRIKPRCPPELEQIEWQCKCGVRGFGHVREKRAGGIAKLKAQMERATGAKFRSRSNTQRNPNQRFTIQYAWTTVREAFCGIWGSSQNATSLPTQHTIQPAGSVQTVQQLISQNLGHLVLMSCMDKEKQRNSLYQDNITTLRGDRILFYFLKERYRERRGRFRSLLSLRMVIGIHFTQFMISISNNVEDLIEPGGSDPQYQCTPIPPGTIPPMMPDYLLHLFNSPSCLHPSEKDVFEQLPKRTKGELACKDNERAKGWGISFEEGWDIVKIVWLFFVVVFLAACFSV